MSNMFDTLSAQSMSCSSLSENAILPPESFSCFFSPGLPFRQELLIATFPQTLIELAEGTQRQIIRSFDSQLPCRR